MLVVKREIDSKVKAVNITKGRKGENRFQKNGRRERERVNKREIKRNGKKEEGMKRKSGST